MGPLDIGMPGVTFSPVAVTNKNKGKNPEEDPPVMVVKKDQSYYGPRNVGNKLMGNQPSDYYSFTISPEDLLPPSKPDAEKKPPAPTAFEFTGSNGDFTLNLGENNLVVYVTGTSEPIQAVNKTKFNPSNNISRALNSAVATLDTTGLKAAARIIEAGSEKLNKNEVAVGGASFKINGSDNPANNELYVFDGITNANIEVPVNRGRDTYIIGSNNSGATLSVNSYVEMATYGCEIYKNNQKTILLPGKSEDWTIEDQYGLGGDNIHLCSAKLTNKADPTFVIYLNASAGSYEKNTNVVFAIRKKGQAENAPFILKFGANETQLDEALKDRGVDPSAFNLKG